MLRQLIRHNSIRLYHESGRHKEKLPSVRIANSRVKHAYAARRDSEASVKVRSGDPNQTFEPFPFKVTEENVMDVLRKKVTPLYDVPYEEQLASKESFCRNALRSLGQSLYASGTPVRLDIKRLPCHVNKIVASPQLSEYRNRDEFSIWRGLDGKTITAGLNLFPIGRHGDTICVVPEGVASIRNEVIELNKIINEFLRSQAKLGVCYSLGTDGGWRGFVIKSNLDKELMLLGYLNPRTLRVGQVLEDRDKFKEFVVARCQEAGLKLKSLYYQPCPHVYCAHKDVPYELLYGEKFLLETIGGHSFRVSPESYLYDSSIGAEVLFETLKDTINEGFMNENQPKPVILHAKSGSGALALNMADIAEQVIGLDSSPQSVDDANYNAQMNDVKNAQFYNAEIEIVLERILEKYARNDQDMLVICDVPNSGIHRNMVHVLRNNRNVNKVIMIIAKIDSRKIHDNILELCTNSRGKHLPPFAPILATPVDTCPQIENFQTILALERLPS